MMSVRVVPIVTQVMMILNNQVLEEPEQEEKFPYYVAKSVKRQLLKAKQKVLETDQDRVYVISGREGSGKSKLARQLAYLIDPTINLDRIIFSSDEFKKAIYKAERGQAIIWDECFKGLSSKHAISTENKLIVQLLQECRYKNLFIFLVLPDFFSLEGYASIFRSNALFNVMISRTNYKLRYYKVYNYDQKQQLYLNGKKTKSYRYPKIYSKNRFYDKEIPTINYDDYVAKKIESFKSPESKEKISKYEQRYRKRFNTLVAVCREKYGANLVEITKELNERGCAVDRTSLNTMRLEKGVYKGTYRES